MTPANKFLSNLDESASKDLGIEIIESDKTRVVGRLMLGPRHINQLGAVQGGIIMMIADIIGAYGAVLNLADGYATSTMESKTNFLSKGSGSVLWGECQPVHLGRTTSVWRTVVWRGNSLADRTRISEVTQTQLCLPEAPDSTIVPIDVAAAIVATTDTGPSPALVEKPVVQITDIRRQEILRGAREVILNKGFARSSVREIAEAADMPIATMYKYVGSKEEILELMYETFINDFHEQLSQVVTDSAGSEERFEFALDATIKCFDKHHKELKLLFTESKALGRDALRRIYAQDRRYLDQWTKIVSDAGADKRLGIDPELLANFIYYLTTVWPMRHWALDRWTLGEVKQALITFVTAACEVSRGKGRK